MKLFKALYRSNYTNEEVTVYAVHLREDGQTDFLTYVDGHWQWDYSYYFTPKDDYE